MARKGGQAIPLVREFLTLRHCPAITSQAVQLIAERLKNHSRILHRWLQGDKQLLRK